ncbi:hypothetical protein U9M48_017837 [Paspalum notatum var. saurae]|uniref:Uncharacterized protein n=1 Tax=Paspalum notatum var. saurae TaxID=547442 RepID=A0AAQ3WP90_PASNO
MASADELCESEVLWPEAPHGDDAPPSCSLSSSVALAARSSTPRGGVPGRPVSRPVDIPRPAARRRDGGDEEGGWSGGSGSGTMVPPHVLVSRRRSCQGGAAAFALRSGPGRARELSHLRNSVLRMTGFIEG